MVFSAAVMLSLCPALSVAASTAGGGMSADAGVSSASEKSIAGNW